jgi:hypothetical protein
VVLLAIGGALLAGWLVRNYLRTRGVAPADPYMLLLPKRQPGAPPFGHTPQRDQWVQMAWLGEESVAQRALDSQEELPF